ncbi:MAG: tRNA (adenosine(37)-N6)-threonylcarbamoyltransferase complex ATPase subunit type 1 TsaE [Christensenellales bacterium]|jgi:tRNA threonylcarbamoyladenosine biosynthesis protein TsaE
MNELRLRSHSEGATEQIGALLAKTLKPGDFVALYGGLGAGKTALCRGIASALGCDDCASPTFTIVREYDTHPPIFHFDAYRLESEEELYDIGCEEYFARPGIVLMEWPERVSGVIPKDHIGVEIEGSGALPRSIRMFGLSNDAYTAIKEAAREYLID